VVLVGSLLNSLLPAVKAEALADVTVFDTSGAMLATSFPGLDGRALEPRAGMATGGAAFRERTTLAGRDYDLLYAPLKLRGSLPGASR
jgi:hypothetical protein